MLFFVQPRGVGLDSWRRNQDLPSASSTSERSALVPVGHEAVLRPGGSRGGIWSFSPLGFC